MGGVLSISSIISKQMLPVYLMSLFTIACIFAFIHNFGWIFNSLSIDKDEIPLSFPRKGITSAQSGPVKYILRGFIHIMKSGKHVCISELMMISSCHQNV